MSYMLVMGVYCIIFIFLCIFDTFIIKYQESILQKLVSVHLLERIRLWLFVSLHKYTNTCLYLNKDVDKNIFTVWEKYSKYDKILKVRDGTQ